MKTVLDLGPGEEGIVKDFSEDSLACRLLTFGLLPETKIQVVSKSPLGNAICLKLGEYLIALRKSEASKIIIQEVNGQIQP